MSPEQLVAILTALAAVLGAIGVVLAQVISLRRQVDGRLEQLLELTATSSHASGVLQEHQSPTIDPPAGPIASKSPPAGP